MARTTKRSEVVSMVGTKWLSIGGSRSPQKGIGKCVPNKREMYSHSVKSGVTLPYACYDSKNAKISTCTRHPLGWWISAHFVKAVKGKMLKADCQKARMQSRADEVRLSRPLTEWSDPHYSRKGARKACSLCHTASARGANCGQACYAWRGYGVASPMLFCLLLTPVYFLFLDT